MIVKRYVYFVAFAHDLGFGNAEVALTSEIDTWEAIHAMQKAVAGMPGVVKESILSYQLMRIEEVPAS